MADIVQLTIELVGADPRVSRTVEVPLSIGLPALHATIQAAMGWEDDHLYEFRIGGRGYGGPHVDWDGVRPAGKAKLADIVASGKRVFEYHYDFGDDWLHKLKIGKLGKAVEGFLYPRLVDGTGACPPEDSGGVWGYQEKLEIMNDATHPDHEEIMDWLGGPIDPASFDRTEAARRVEQLALALTRRNSRGKRPKTK